MAALRPLSKTLLRKGTFRKLCDIRSVSYLTKAGFGLPKDFPGPSSSSSLLLASFLSTERKQYDVFDRFAKRRQRDRAALMGVLEADQLRDEVAWHMVDRVHDIDRNFERALDLGCGRGHIAKHLDLEKVTTLVQCDSSAEMLKAIPNDTRNRDLAVQCDEERLSFKQNEFDLVMSNLSMHWVNDIPGVLTQIRNCLKPDGVFIGTMFGKDTLFELRCSLQLAEQERIGGFSSHISPFAEANDIGSLLTRTGFVLTTVDTDEITINFPSMVHLLEELRAMGETHAAYNRTGVIRRDVLLAASSIYQTMYGNPDGTIPATFHVIHMLGWKPDSSQPLPKKRGSATASLKSIGHEPTTPNS